MTDYPVPYYNKVIFLDIDGVMCFHPELENRAMNGLGQFNEGAIMRLNRLLALTGAQIVVSSTWRISVEWLTLQRHFRDQGIMVAPVDRTPDAAIAMETGIQTITTPDGQKHHSQGQWFTSTGRGSEIQLWLKDHPQVEKYVIFDDDRDMLPSQKENFVWIEEGMFKGGILDEHVEKAIAILGVKT